MEVSFAVSVESYTILTIWFIFCCLGPLETWVEPFRFPTLLLAIIRRVGSIISTPYDLCPDLFMIYILGRVRIKKRWERFRSAMDGPADLSYYRGA